MDFIMKDSETLAGVAQRSEFSIISIFGWPENEYDQEIEDIHPGKINFIPIGADHQFDWTR
jgi:hypothetical protein